MKRAEVDFERFMARRPRRDAAFALDFSAPPFEWSATCTSHTPRHQRGTCYLQSDGEHIRHEACACDAAGMDGCPIDYHRHLHMLRNPAFEVQPVKVAAAAAGAPR